MLRKQKNEKKLIIVLTIIFGISFISDIIPSMVVSGLSSKLSEDDFYSTVLALFQIQATVSAFGIAVISLIASLHNETVLGIFIPKYFLQLKNKYLKLSYVILISLFSLMISYICISFKFYNSVIAIFFIVIILIMYLSNEVFSIFTTRKSNLKKEIKDFILKLPNRKRFNLVFDIDDDMTQQYENNEDSKFKENFEMLIEIFKNDYNEIITIKTEIELWSDLFRKNIQNLYKRESSLPGDFSSYKYIFELVKIDISNKANIWSSQVLPFYTSFREKEVIKYDDYCIIKKIRRQLYDNLNDLDEAYYLLPHFSSTIYHHILLNESVDFTENYEKVNCYNTIKNNIKYGFRSELQQNILYDELLRYIIALIQKYDYKTLNNTIIDEIESNRTLNVEELEIFYSMLIYLYYLIEKEELVKKEIKEKHRQFINENSSSLYFYLLAVTFSPVKTTMEKILKNLSVWEIYPEKEAKFVMMESVIRNFFIFNSLYLSKNKDELYSRLNNFIKENAFSTYENYNIKKSEMLAKEYEKFVKLFYQHAREFNYEKAKEEIILLDTVISEIYKVQELKESFNNDYSESKKNELIRNLMDKLSFEIRRVSNLFLGNSKDYKMIKVKKIIPIEFPITFDANNAELYKMFMNTFIIYVIRSINEKIKVNKLDFQKDDILAKFFGELSKQDVVVDLLIGYRDWFYDSKEADRFNEFQKGMKKIVAPFKLSNILLAVNSHYVALQVNNISIKIEKLNIDEVKKKLKRDKEGKYLFNVTNEIFLPFDENELKNYIDNTEREIKLEIDYEIGFASNKIGVSIVNKN